MQSITATRWLDEKNHTLDFVENQLLAHHPDEGGNGSANYANWDIQKAFPENQAIT